MLKQNNNDRLGRFFRHVVTMSRVIERLDALEEETRLSGEPKSHKDLATALYGVFHTAHQIAHDEAPGFETFKEWLDACALAPLALSAMKEDGFDLSKHEA